jgi:hypothetical protein
MEWGASMNPRAELKRAKVALVLAKKLEAASAAMQTFRYACIDCGENYPYADDTRITLPAAMEEYAGYLEDRYKKVIRLDTF